MSRYGSVLPRRFLFLLSFLVVLAIPVAAFADARVSESYGKLPLHFEANQGQAHQDVRYLSRGPGYSLYLTAGEAVLVLTQPKADSDGGEQAQSAALRMGLVGAARKPLVTAREELPGKANYFIGSDPAKWRTNVPTYAKVHYRDVYPGIDLVYYGNQRSLEYDFIVAPGADPRKIALSFKGADKLEIDAQGDLVLHAAGGTVRQKKPVIYQDIDGLRTEIEGAYVRKGVNRIGFKVAAYDTSRPLVIDPVLAYSTFLGGNSLDLGNGIAVDADGNAYVTGTTLSSDFPTSSGTSHTVGRIFVTKLNPAGSALVYSILMGGSNESFPTSSIAPDAAGNAYVAGTTSSNDFPTTAGAFQTSLPGDSAAFVTKLNPDGSVLVYSTYLGGSAGGGANRIAVDAAGSAYVTGVTASTDFPTTAGAFDTSFNGGGRSSDAFVTKLDPSGSQLVYSTYLGASGNERGTGIAVDAAGSAYVTGVATLADPGGPFTHLLPTTPGAFQQGPGGLDDAFVAKLNPAGSALIYCTYLGGPDPDGGNAIAVDVDGNAYVTGTTGGLTDFFPTTPGAFQTAQTNRGARGGFVTKLNSSGSALVYSTYFLPGNGIAVDAAGSAYVTGSAGIGFPTTPGAFQTSFGGGDGDAFMTKFDPTGSALLYSSYLGGGGGDAGSGIAVDTAGNAYVIGHTTSPDFPTTAGAVQTTFGGITGITDAFVAKFAFGGAVLLVIDRNGIDEGKAPAFFSAGQVNDDVAAVGVRAQLRFFAQSIGQTITLPTGRSRHEGWFALTAIPASWAQAGGVAGFVGNPAASPEDPAPHGTGPGLGAPGAKGRHPQALLRRVPGVTALHETGLNSLVGRDVCAVVHDNNVRINRHRHTADLAGKNLGTVAFRVLALTPPSGRPKALPDLEVKILDARTVCSAPFTLLTGAEITAAAPGQ